MGYFGGFADLRAVMTPQGPNRGLLSAFFSAFFAPKTPVYKFQISNLFPYLCGSK